MLLVLPLVRPEAVQVGQENYEPRQEAVRGYLGPQHQAPSWPSFCSLHEFRAPPLLLVSFWYFSDDGLAAVLKQLC